MERDRRLPDFDESKQLVPREERLRLIDEVLLRGKPAHFDPDSPGAKRVGELVAKHAQERKEIKKMLETGNLDCLSKQHPERRGWLISSYVEDSVLRKSSAVEVKWVRWPKGAKKSSESAFNDAERTVVVLLSGKWRQCYGQSGTEHILSAPGDYSMFTGQPHHCEALEDTHLMVIRWIEPQP